MTPSFLNRLKAGRHTPTGIALIYAALAALWIILSTCLLNFTVADPLLQSRIELAKGLAFVAVTSGLLYLLLNHWRESHAAHPAQTELPEPPKLIRLVLIFIALVLLVPLIAGVVYELNVPEIEAQTFNNLNSIAQLKTEEIKNWLKERRADAQLLIADAGFTRDVEHFLLTRQHEAGLLMLIRAQLAALQADYAFDSIMLLDTSGRLITSLGMNAGISEPIRNLMLESLDSKQIERSNLYRDESGSVHLDWIVPLFASDRHGKRPVALIILRTMPDKFLYPLIQNWPTASPSGESLLVRREGESVLFLNSLRHSNHAPLTIFKSLNNLMLPAAVAIRENRSGALIGQDYRQVPVLAAYRPVPGTDWYLIAKIDRDEVMLPFWNMLFWISVIAFVAVGFIAVVLLLYHRQMQRSYQLALLASSVEAIRERELRYRTLVETIPDLVWLKDEKGVYLSCNPVFERLYGAREADIIGKSDYDFADRARADSFREHDLQAMAADKPSINEEWLTFAGNGYRGLFETIKTPMKNANGKLIGVLGVSRDITKRKLAEESLRKLSQAVEQSPSTIVITDLEAKIEYANAAFVKESGYSLEEAIGKNPKLLHSGKTPKSTYDDMWAHLTNGKPWEGEFINRRKDGSEYIESALISPVFQPDGRMTHYLAIKENITERKAAEARIVRLTQVYSALSQCNLAIVRSTNEQELFIQICQGAVQFGGMTMAWIGQVDEASRQIRPVACYGSGTEYLEHIRFSADAADPFGRGPAGITIRENRPYWCQDFAHDPALEPWRERANKAGWAAMAALPLHRHGSPSGILALYSDTLNAFDAEARKLLTEMAVDISFALDNFVHEAERKQAQQEILLKNTILQTQQETTLDAILIVDDNRRIISYNRQFLDLWAPAADIVDKGDDAPLLQSVVDQCLDPQAFLERVNYLYEHHDEKSHEEIPLKNGRVLDRYSAPLNGDDGHYYGRVWYFRDISERKHAERELLDSEQRFRGLVEQSLAGIYIIQDGKLVYVNPRAAEIVGLGSVNDMIGKDLKQFIFDADYDKIVENIRELLDKKVPNVALEFRAIHKQGHTITLGANASYAFYHGQPAVIGLIQDISVKKRDEERILQYVNQLKSTFMSTVQLATSLSEMRDPYTAGHERRVSDIAVAIATKMGLDEHRIEGIKVAGFLHDIGKISIPAEILVKPGRLTATEYALVQGHAQASYDVLKHVEFPWPVAIIALQHHERMDGSGYPNGLKGDEILLESRIMAVADVVEAMASHRPYRPGLGIDKALTELERGRGSAYDPDVVDICLRLFREQEFVLPPY
ncbi:MAG TPA: PAS domain S-box protein [Gallionella sp.]|nr:PAS domain S-box protein [Gallionella sp.]